MFSKVMEAYVLDRLCKETKFENCKYGGIKGMGVDHFLVKTWDEVLQGLQDGRACITLTSIVFEKAVNRMDHVVWLRALSDHGCLQVLHQLSLCLLDREDDEGQDRACPLVWETSSRRQPAGLYTWKLPILHVN